MVCFGVSLHDSPFGGEAVAGNTALQAADPSLAGDHATGGGLWGKLEMERHAPFELGPHWARGRSRNIGNVWWCWEGISAGQGLFGVLRQDLHLRRWRYWIEPVTLPCGPSETPEGGNEAPEGGQAGSRRFWPLSQGG